MTTHKRIERKHTVALRVSASEKKEIDDLARETKLGTSALLRYAFTLARDRIAKAGSPCGENGGGQ